MTFRGDPYRVLGLPPGSTTAEVKRAYRLLAKRHHPDAGEGSVARFLEIQAAYEVLARLDTADEAHVGSGRAPGRRPAQPGPRGAGPRRAGGESPAGGQAPPAGTEWARRPREEAGRPAGAGSGHAGDRGRRGRDRRKATLGSTTYDDQGEAAEPSWDGAAWYGPASGTYWTLNPREYADPRKHGPDYLARSSSARARSLHDRAPDQPPGPGQPPDAPAAASGDSSATQGPRGRPTAARDRRPTRPDARQDATPDARFDATAEARPGATAEARPGATADARFGATAEARPGAPASRAASAHATAATAASTATASARPATPPRPHPPAMPPVGPRSPGETARSRFAAAPAAAAARGGHVMRLAWPRPAERLVVGGLGWLPFGMLLAAAAGLPGGIVATLPLQAVGLIAMARAPRLAWASAGGLVAVIAVAIPGVAALAALGVGARPGGPAPVALIVLAALAWCGGALLAASGRLIERPWRAGP